MTERNREEKLEAVREVFFFFFSAGRWKMLSIKLAFGDEETLKGLSDSPPNHSSSVFINWELVNIRRGFKILGITGRCGPWEMVAERVGYQGLTARPTKIMGWRPLPRALHTDGVRGRRG